MAKEHPYAPWRRLVLVPCWIIEVLFPGFTLGLVTMGVSSIIRHDFDDDGDESSRYDGHVRARLAIGFVNIIFSAWCIIATSAEIVFVLRRKMRPLVFLIVNIFKSSCWTALFILSFWGEFRVSQRTMPNIISRVVDLILLLAFYIPLAHGAIVFHGSCKASEYEPVGSKHASFSSTTSEPFPADFPPAYKTFTTIEQTADLEANGRTAGSPRRLRYNHVRDTRFDSYRRKRRSLSSPRIVGSGNGDVVASPMEASLSGGSRSRSRSSGPQVPAVQSAKLQTGMGVRHGENAPLLGSSTSDAATVTRGAAPPSRLRTPGRSFENLGDSTEVPLIGKNNWEASPPRDDSNMVRFDEQQIRDMEAEASKRPRRMSDQVEDESPPTPNNDDTPFIRFAIDQLTRDEEAKREARRAQQLDQGQPPTNSQSSEEYPVERIIPDGNRYIPQRPTRAELALIRKHRSTPGPGRLFGLNTTRPLSTSPTRDLRRVPIPPRQPSPTPGNDREARNDKEAGIFIPTKPPLDANAYSELKFLPTILKPFSLVAIITLCLLMTAAIMFCAIYSDSHEGLYPWVAGIHGGRYFIFGFLPPILGACIFLYVQYVLAALARILPYCLMAMEDAEARTNALFLEAFPRHMFWPRWDGPIMLDIGGTCLWLSVFTIPLQGCLFSVVLVDGHWTWTAVQGIAWTLVAIYISMCMGLVLIGAFLFRRTTGLLWDPRSLADLIALLPRSNSLDDYPGTETMSSQKEIRAKLADRSDRLGYWRTPSPAQGIFYSIGETGALIRRYTLEGGKAEREASDGSSAPYLEESRSCLHDPAMRFRYIPWFLRDKFVVLWCVAAFSLLLALAIVSFLPSTAIRHGFPPLVVASPNASGFSAANFLYSFLPSFIGMMLYLLFQPIDMAFRKLQPWVELAHPEGASAEKSLLLDYTAALPLPCTFTAVRNGHFRVACFSLASFLFIILPILGGGMFFPLTVAAEVRMLPNLPAFYTCLAGLTIYFLALLLVVPKRKTMRLPHAVDCLAEVISFVHSSNVLDDASFHAPASKADLVTRLVSTSSSSFCSGREGARYVFGVGFGRRGKETLGVERLGRSGEEDVMVMG
ncbi:hypothetical protein DSL72_001913 [Monilinia vaccinii-corymbosi]|uniref:Uncharacterized protein n=1 Tax=Monilinia vaccinii-corymbosi TaxID=61207 RepID=A0A8A3PB65_9HELO|nr:hypothetical protein DSL72_001913 [Monilinia vaccinii-corymbosi]